jgi:putative spermidine/putrescine transport system permease protein
VHSSRVASGRPDHVQLGWRIVDGLIAIRRARISRRLRRVGPILLIAPGVALVVSLGIGLATLGWSSLHTYDSFLGLEGRVSTTQYSQVYHDPQFRVVLQRTLAMATVTALIAVALAIPFSLVMANVSNRTLRLALMVVIFIPFLTGDITRTFGWLALLGPQGPLVWSSNELGFQFPNLIGTLWAVGLGSTQVLLPVAVVILLPAVLRLDPELERAASTLGARRTQTFLRVTLPQLRASCFGALAACWALGMGEFADPAILGQGVKDFLANFLQDRYLNLGDGPLGAAVGMFLLAMISLGVALILTLGRLGRRRSRL